MKALLKNIEMTHLNADGTTETHRYDQINEYEFRRVEPEYCECPLPLDNSVQGTYSRSVAFLEIDRPCPLCTKPVNPVWTWHPGDPKPTTMPKGCVVQGGDLSWRKTNLPLSEWEMSTYRWNILKNQGLEFEPAVAESETTEPTFEVSIMKADGTTTRHTVYVRGIEFVEVTR